MKQLIFYLLVVCLCTNSALQAQNVVTIFGEDKVEKTDEGAVFHHFTDGLYLPGGANPGTLFNGQDMIAWLYATGRFVTPHAGDSLGLSYPNVRPIERNLTGNNRMWAEFAKRFGQMVLWKWAPLSVDTAGVFQHPFLRNSYLYTAYESPKEQAVLLETTGGTRTFVNGVLHEGDHYDFGYSLTPIILKKGLNEFVYTPGRFGRVKSQLVHPGKPVQFTQRDMTKPDLLIGGTEPQWAAIRVINMTAKPLKQLAIRATLAGGETATYTTDDVMPMSVRKVKYQLPALKSGSAKDEKATAKIELLDPSGKVLDATEIAIRKMPATEHHNRTFVSKMDGSVQFFGVSPAKREHAGEKKGLVLSVHGAGVDAGTQAACYAPKDWTDLVAATNRRPYGFNWEAWGRVDGLEVLAEGRRIFQPDSTKIYLTGHSMGGHGTWILGTLYPDRFAAIAPCAGYPDIAGYGRSRTDEMHSDNPNYEPFERAAHIGRTLSMVQNLKQSGVYIFHGSEDHVVSTEQARMMRNVLGRFHADFCYYEYPGGEHWFGTLCMDWPPIFDYFKWHAIPAKKDVKKLDFYTASPGVSPSDYWLRIEQQTLPLEFTRVYAEMRKDTLCLDTVINVKYMTLDMPSMGLAQPTVPVKVGEQTLAVPTNQKANLTLAAGQWSLTGPVSPKQKYSGRYGGFKAAFDNRVVLVYATGGSKAEKAGWRDKAYFDAETFYYRANGSVDIIPDTDYKPAKYAGRNVVIYGNKDNNKAWSLLLKNSPVQAGKGEITAGSRSWRGDDLGAYFVYPNPNDDTTLVGVVTGTGEVGMRATMPNNYISGITGFPDVMIFRADMLHTGLDAMEFSGFFDMDWGLSSPSPKGI